VRELAWRVERRKWLSAMIALTFCFSAILALLVTSSSDGTDAAVRESPTGKDAAPVRTLTLTVHDPILIDGDDGFTNASGVIWGTGSSDDPYVIEGWDIQGPTGTSCIAVQSTSAHFLIRDCYLHDCGVASGGSGISLLLCSNGRIERCTAVNNDQGIEMVGVTGMVIQDSYCSMNSKGVNLVSSDHILVMNNTLADGNGYGLYFGHSWDNICLRNNLSFNYQYGMLASESDNNTFEDNAFGFNDGPGIRFESSDNNTLVENTCSYNDYGIDLAESSNNTICNNTFRNNNGAGDIYSPAHVQASDDRSSNWWNSTDGYGNYWSDWTSPDSNMDGIVDDPYLLDGSAGAKDYYPLTTALEPIPEFGTMPLVVMGLLVIFVLIMGARRKNASRR